MQQLHQRVLKAGWCAMRRCGQQHRRPSPAPHPYCKPSINHLHARGCERTGQQEEQRVLQLPLHAVHKHILPGQQSPLPLLVALESHQHNAQALGQQLSHVPVRLQAGRVAAASGADWVTSMITTSSWIHQVLSRAGYTCAGKGPSTEEQMCVWRVQQAGMNARIDACQTGR